MLIHLSGDTYFCKGILAQFPALAQINVPSLVIFSVSASPSFYLKPAVYQRYLSCLADFGMASGPTHLGQGRRATVEDGGDLSANKVCL